VTCLVYNKTVPDDDFIKSKHVVIKTQVFLLVVLTDKIKSMYLIRIVVSCEHTEQATCRHGQSTAVR
jgi:hypothetical protein